MSLVYWDAMLFIYLIEKNPEYAPRVKEILAELNARDDTLCTSIFTIGEVLTGAYAKGAVELATEIKQLMKSPDILILPFTAEIADHYARIRARYRVRPADAIHLATAADAKVDLFVTNDRALHKLVVPGIQFVVRMDAGFF